MISAEQVVGRIGKKIAAARNISVSEFTIRKILKLEHLNLHLIMANILREYLTATTDAVTLVEISTGSGLAISQKKLPIGSLTVESVAVTAKEIQSVVNATFSAPYKKAISLEHFSALGQFDEDGIYGRYWFQNRGSSDILIFQGSEVLTAETSLRVGITKELDTSYADVGADLSEAFDCPSEAISFLVSQTSAKCFEDKRAEIPEWLNQEVIDNKEMVKSADANFQAQLMALEQRGADVRA